MPKVKTNSGAKKRFALTGSGKIKRKHAFKSHILTKKTKKQKRNLYLHKIPPYLSYLSGKYFIRISTQ